MESRSMGENKCCWMKRRGKYFFVLSRHSSAGVKKEALRTGPLRSPRSNQPWEERGLLAEQTDRGSHACALVIGLADRRTTVGTLRYVVEVRLVRRIGRQLTVDQVVFFG